MICRPSYANWTNVVEGIELALREQVATTLDDDPEAASGARPAHVLQKADERIRAAAKKNANIELDQYKQLRRTLEYCDLRELQDTILNKILWQGFEQRFARTRRHCRGSSASWQSSETVYATVDRSTRSRAKRARQPSCGSNRCSPAHEVRQ